MENMLHQNINNVGDAMQSGIIKSIESDYVSNIHSRSVVVSVGNDSDIYTETKNLGYSIGTRENIEAWSKKLTKRVKPSKTTTDILQQIVDEINAQEEEELKKNIKEQLYSLNLKPTAHPALMVDDESRYYRFDDNKYLLDQSILSVDELGNYTVQASLGSSSDRLITTYNKEHKPIIFRIVDAAQVAYKSSRYVAKRLKMKQELVKRYKLHGYCGNSKGVTAVIKNMFSDPRPTGYYFDKSYNFYSWNSEKSQFEVQERMGNVPGSPMLSDYEFKEDTVIRTDYDGVGICL